MENGPSIGEKLFEWARNALLVMILILVVGALGGAGWYYFDSTHPKSSAAIPGTSSSFAAGLAGPGRSGPSGAAANAPSRVAVQIAVQPGDQFREDVKDALVKELVAIYPQVSALSWRSDGQDPTYQNSVFNFLSSAENAAPAQRPPMLLAADFMLDPVVCSEASKDKCDQLRGQFAGHKLSFPYRGHDLLWRIWKEYPSSEWGERAFVLLLLSGWEASGSCTKSADQFREIIRQGEAFLEQHASSPNRALVTNLVGQAYATWWSLSMEADTRMEGKIDPKAFREGGEQARTKAVGDFEKVLEISPQGLLADYSRQVLPPLRNRQLTALGFPFLCLNNE